MMRQTFSMKTTQDIPQQKQEHDRHAIADRGFVLCLIAVVEPLQKLFPCETGHIIYTSHVVEELFQSIHVVIFYAIVGIEPCTASICFEPIRQRFACCSSRCTRGRSITLALRRRDNISRSRFVAQREGRRLCITALDAVCLRAGRYNMASSHRKRMVIRVSETLGGNHVTRGCMRQVAALRTRFFILHGDKQLQRILLIGKQAIALKKEKYRT